jgi:hypothetical protein
MRASVLVYEGVLREATEEVRAFAETGRRRNAWGGWGGG